VRRIMGLDLPHGSIPWVSDGIEEGEGRLIIWWREFVLVEGI
jgi:hypothetical protein